MYCYLIGHQVERVTNDFEQSTGKKLYEYFVRIVFNGIMIALKLVA